MFPRRLRGSLTERGNDRRGSAAPVGQSGTVDSEDESLLAALRRGDEVAFATLFKRHQNSMLEVAMIYLPDIATAEEVVQETWLAVIEGLDRFEGRSSLKTWIFSIVTNRAKTRYLRDLSNPVLQPFLDDAEYDGSPELPAALGWPSNWGDTPEKTLLSKEVRAYLHKAITSLPSSRQREVITLRDLEGWTADEVCRVLGITTTNQRVLLHRARSHVKVALDQYFARSRVSVG